MANRLFGKAREGYGTGKLDFVGDDVKALLIDLTKYNPITGGTIDTDEFLTDISGIAGAIIATSANLAGKSMTLGVANCAAFTFTVVAGAAGGAIVTYHDSGVPGTSRIEAWIDTAASGLPTPAGTLVVTVTPDAGANKLFKL